MISRAMRATGRHILKSTSVSGEIYGMEHADGSQSDTALGSLGSGIKKRRSSLSQRVVAILPSRRSRSTSQLSQTGQRPPPKKWNLFQQRQTALWFGCQSTTRHKQTFKCTLAITEWKKNVYAAQKYRQCVECCSISDTPGFDFKYIIGVQSLQYLLQGCINRTPQQ